jgi:choline/glycine/proline betaine transport protein
VRIPKPRTVEINPPVFVGAAALILAFVIFGAGFPDTAANVFSAVQSWIVETFGWFYMFAVAVFVIFAIALALSSHGKVRLGPDDARPDFSYTSWFAMLFSAGMGIGLMFFGVAEPVMHYTNPPTGEGGDVAAAREAMNITFFHWGVHAWAIYAVVALSLAYFGYRYGLPLTIRSALYPLIGERIYGPIGHAVDLFAVLGTMFGVATSLGLGVTQVNSGLAYLFGVPDALTVQLILIAGITLMATASVVSGLDKGIKRLSELNLILALVLVLFVLVLGPTLFLLEALVQNIGAYLTDAVNKTFNLYAYQKTDWLGGWTLFYWAWWIAWSPFVGMFIARVSRGRTVREFIAGVLFVPVGVTFVWMTVFGNTAIQLDMGQAAGAIAAAVDENTSTALFKFLEYFPLAEVASVVATLLVITFFVTSSDSGSLVIDIVTSGGNPDPPKWQRVFWALTEGVVAAVLLIAGGLSALQTAAITAALPFVFVMLIVCYGLYRGLQQETVRRNSQGLPANIQIRGAQIPWEQRLKAIVVQAKERQAQAFLQETAKPALEEVRDRVRDMGLQAEVQANGKEVSLTVFHDSQREFLYAVRLRCYRMPVFTMSQVPPDEGGRSQEYYRAEVHLLEGGQDYDVIGYTKEQLIADLLSQYDRHMHYLQVVSR